MKQNLSNANPITDFYIESVNTPKTYLLFLLKSKRKVKKKWILKTKR